MGENQAESHRCHEERNRKVKEELEFTQEELKIGAFKPDAPRGQRRPAVAKTTAVSDMERSWA